MNYILKKIEKKVYINNNNFLILNIIKNKNMYELLFSNSIRIILKFNNIFDIKNYLIESGIIKY
jgi:hypothetical protein